MHAKKIVHRDLKPSNILLDIVNIVKVCDFGASKKIETENALTYTGTFYYMAPEIHETKNSKNFSGGYDRSADVWSLGVILY
jgi:serine/threonine protein kinase